MNQSIEHDIVDAQLDNHEDAFYQEMPMCCREAYRLGRLEGLLEESRRNSKAIENLSKQIDEFLESQEVG